MRRAGLVAVLLLGGLASCGSSAPTAARVVFAFDASVAIDQVRLQAELSGVDLVSADVPKTPLGQLATGQDAVVLFEDRLGGAQVSFLAAGLDAGAEVARGEGSVTLVAGGTVTVTVTLTTSAGCPAGQHGCTDGCYANDDAQHCGLACAACSAPSHGAATCAANACSFGCDVGFTRCGSECVDLKTDARNCNACAHSCAANQICQGGSCVLNSCPSGQHGCNGSCVPDADPATCGSRCDPCPTPANGSATCDGTACGVACNGGYHACSGACLSTTSPDSCGARCTPCPAYPNAVAGCNGTTCTYSCASGYHACSSACVANTDPATCGASCTPCPSPPDHAVATCDGASCGYACQSGYVDCSGWCQVSGQPCDVCPPCATGQYCYTAAGVCYTPGQCASNQECVSGSCSGGYCTCNMLPPAIGCRPHEQCLLQYCVPTGA